MCALYYWDGRCCISNMCLLFFLCHRGKPKKSTWRSIGKDATLFIGAKTMVLAGWKHRIIKIHQHWKKHLQKILWGWIFCIRNTTYSTFHQEWDKKDWICTHFLCYDNAYSLRCDRSDMLWMMTCLLAVSNLYIWRMCGCSFFLKWDFVVRCNVLKIMRYDAQMTTSCRMQYRITKPWIMDHK